MSSETEVISCPACKHLLRVPADWLGTQVQCPECRAMFKAPVRDGDRLTEPELVSRPADATAPQRGKIDAMLLIPAFALMFLSVASLIVNAVTLYDIASDTAAFEEGKRAQLEKLAPQLGQDPQAMAGGVKWEFFAGASAWGLACAAVAFLGGLGMARRRWYWLARVGCVAAALNVPACCCVGGVPVGIWGFLMLMSSEGRAHFGR